MSVHVYAGLTSQYVDVFLGDASSLVGDGLAGLAYNTASLTCYYRKGMTGSSTAVTLASQTVGGAWTSGGFVEIDATYQKGIYRFDIPNAAVDSAGFVTLYFQGAADLVVTALRVDCRPVPADVKQIQADSQSATDFKDLVDTGYDPSAHKVAGVVLVDTTTTNTDMRGTDSAFLAASAPTNFADLAITASTGLVSLGAILGAAFTETTAGNLAANLSFFFDLDVTTTNTANDVGSGGDATEAKQDTIIGALTTIGGNVVDVLGDTVELQTDWVNGGRLDALLDACATAAGMAAAFTEIQGAGWNSSTDALVNISNDIGSIGADVDDVLTNVTVDIPGLLAALNNISTAEVNAEVASALATYDGPTNTEMVAAFTQIKGATWTTTDTLEAIRDRGDSAWATATESIVVSGLSSYGAATATVLGDVYDLADATYTAVTGLNNFNPATDTVAHVTLVDTTTTNTDMRGTDSAFLAASAPTNFADLAITASTGLVSVGTNMDKEGYSIAGIKTTLDDLTDLTVAALLAGDMGNGRLIIEALAVLRNKIEVVTNVLTVYGTDDTTTLFSANISTAAGNPISSIDPI